MVNTHAQNSDGRKDTDDSIHEAALQSDDAGIGDWVNDASLRGPDSHAHRYANRDTDSAVVLH
jgi:hypothetical protein